MERDKPITRNSFIRWMAGLSAVFTGWLWFRLARKQAERENRQEFRHGQDLPQGIAFWGKYYTFRSLDSVRAFSTTCTHAGCRIGKGQGEKMHCSCHGSQYNGKTGVPVKGPAIHPLRELECRFERETEQWIVVINPV